MITRLNDRFRLLTGGGRTALPRQQTLRAAIDWSHDLLSQDERTLLRRVSIFSGGFTVELAEEICAWAPLDPADVLDLLGMLVSKSLVAAEQVETGQRYRLLETIRDYAAERARMVAEDGELQNRHRRHFLARAEEAERELHGPEQLRWFDLIDSEIANFRAAFDCCLASEDADAALRIAAGLGLYWRARGHFTEGRGWLERALAPNEAAPATLRAKALSWASYLAIYQGAYTQAQIRGEESLNLYRAAEDGWGMGFALQVLGAVALNQDDYPTAAQLEEESVRHLRRTGDTDGLGLSYVYLGVVALRRGEYTLAMGLLEQALLNFREVGDMRRVSIALRIMGEVELCQGHYTPATTLLDESLGLVRSAKDRVDLGLVVYLLGQAARAAEDYPAPGCCSRRAWRSLASSTTRSAPAWPSVSWPPSRGKWGARTRRSRSSRRALAPSSRARSSGSWPASMGSPWLRRSRERRNGRQGSSEPRTSCAKNSARQSRRSSVMNMTRK